MEHKNCRGCHYGTDNACVLLNLKMDTTDYQKLEKCPCNLCLIKAMCTKRCIEFSDFYIGKIKRSINTPLTYEYNRESQTYEY